MRWWEDEDDALSQVLFGGPKMDDQGEGNEQPEGERFRRWWEDETDELYQELFRKKGC